MQRHQQGDWGECSPEDTLANNQALKDEPRILSIYKLPPHLREATEIPKIWILTEADCSATIVIRIRPHRMVERAADAAAVFCAGEGGRAGGEGDVKWR